MRNAGLLLLAIALVAASDAASSGERRPRAAVAWVMGGSLNIQDAGGRAAVALPALPNATLDQLTWLPDGRRVAVVRGTVLDIVDARTRRLQTFAPPGRGPTQVAFADDGRVAIARGPAACGPADPNALQLHVVGVTGDMRTVPVFPESSPPEQRTFYWLTELTWSRRGVLSYVVHQRRGSCNAPMRSTLVATGARQGEAPRALVSFRPWSSFAASANWRADGRRLAYAFSTGGLIGVGDLAPDGSAHRRASLRTNANTVRVDWVGRTPLLLVNDDADVDTYAVDLRRRRLRVLLRARFWGQHQPAGLAAASRDGRYLSFDTSDGGVGVVDMRARRRWFVRAYFVAASPDGKFLAIERGPLVQPAARRGQLQLVDVRTHQRRKIPTPRRYEEIAVSLR